MSKKNPHFVNYANILCGARHGSWRTRRLGIRLPKKRPRTFPMTGGKNGPRPIGQLLPERGVTLAAAIGGVAGAPSNEHQAHNALFLLRMRQAATMLMIAMLLAIAAPMGAQAQGAANVNALNSQVTQLYGQGKYTEATPIAQQALRLAERVLGSEHPATLASVNNLAELYLVQGRYGEAEPLYRRALETSERVLGKDHPVRSQA